MSNMQYVCVTYDRNDSEALNILFSIVGENFRQTYFIDGVSWLETQSTSPSLAQEIYNSIHKKFGWNTQRVDVRIIDDI